MSFNISSYKENINKFGVLRSNRFEVRVVTPPILQGSAIVTAAGAVSSDGSIEMLKFRAEQFRAPGITLDSKPVYRYGMGPYQKMPYSGRYTDNNLTFLADGYGIMWNFWYQWVNSIFNFAGNDAASGSVVGGFNTRPSYQVEYKDKYATTISVVMFNTEGQEVQTINMFDAYPIAFNDVQLSWGQKNEIVRITVGITFREFSIEKSTIGVNYSPSTKTPTFVGAPNSSSGSPNPPTRNP